MQSGTLLPTLKCMSLNHAVSVVIPSFNRPQLTLRAVKSVLAQTWANFEILVIDDGSRSDQVFPIQLVDDARVRLIQHPTNLGVSAARNTGVNESRGSLIAFLDSDDWWLPQKLANQVATYVKQGSKENVFVYSSYYREQHERRSIYPLSSWKRNQALSDFIFLDCGNIHTSTWLASRGLLQRFPFDLQLSQCEDYDVLLRMEAAGVEFVSSKTPGAIHNCDLRDDRLSTRLSTDLYSRFLEQNSQRLTPKSYVVLESIIINAKGDGRLGTRLLNHIHHFFRSSRLNWLARVNLVFSYLTKRLATKIRSRCRVKKRAFI
jgi:glycosyltransferase involved in cell wall biosynthesis